MPQKSVLFAPLPASDRIKAALQELQGEYLRTLDKTGSEMGRILALAAARQANLIVENLESFDRRGTHIYSSSRNLALLEDLTNRLAELDVPVRDSARQAWVDQALELRAVLQREAPKLGIDLKRTDFARASLQVVEVMSQNAFSQLSDFAQLQRGTLLNLKTEMSDGMARSLDYRSLAAQVKSTGITDLPAIPGFRRAFSLEERAESIGRTETVRAQTQLQDTLGEEAGLDYGRSYLNWNLDNHDERCLLAEAFGWAPVTQFQDLTGLPPRHTRCGCHWQRGLKDWVDPEEGPEAMAADFAARAQENGVKLSQDLFQKLPPLVQGKVGQMVKASKPAALTPAASTPAASTPSPAARPAPTLPAAAATSPRTPQSPPQTQAPVQTPQVPQANRLPPELDIDELLKLDLHQVEPSWANPTASRAYGGVLVDNQGRVLLREPTGHFDGYHWTFAKGKPNPSDHPATTATREVLEETGHYGGIVGLVPGKFKSGSGSDSFYFLMRSKAEDPSKMDTETQSTKWATIAEAKLLISQSTNAGGRARDLAILDAAEAAWSDLLAGNQVPSLVSIPTLTQAQVQAKEAQKQAAAAAALAAQQQAAALAQQQAQAALAALQAPVTQVSAPIPTPQGFPADISTLQDVRLLGGSTGARLVRDPVTGKHYVLKRGANPDHLLEEAAADAAYQALGVRVPAFRVYQTPTGPVKLAEFIQGGEVLSDVLRDPARSGPVIDQLQQHFAADALLGNWDVIGLTMDNVLVDAAGQVWRIDNGGALRRRAMGTLKNAADWTESPTEIFTLRDARRNAQTARIFGGLSIYDIAAQVKRLEQYRSRLGQALPSDLKDIVLARLDTLSHVARTVQEMQVDRWMLDYVERFSEHVLGLRHAGVIGKISKELRTSLDQDHHDRLGFKEYEVSGVVDENGRPWDNLRGARSVMKDLIDYVSRAGGDWAILENYMRDQSYSSWSSTSQALKYYFITEARSLPRDRYFWLQGPDTARNHLQTLVAAQGADKLAISLAAAHAFTHEMLTKLKLPNKAGQDMLLVRSEPLNIIRTQNGLRPGDQDVTMKRGALESSSVWKAISVAGSEVTLQKVPLHRIFLTFLNSRGANNQDALLGDGENEFVFFPEGLLFDYATWQP